jgi:hypothetical protein
MYRILIVILFVMLLSGCQEIKKTAYPPLLVLKTGDYTSNEDAIPIGGKISFGITATEGSAPLTNLRISRLADEQLIVELDKGMFIESGGLDFTFNAVKSGAQTEVWQFMVMNANRDSAVKFLTVNLGEGSAYGPILHFPSIKLGMQHNTIFPQFLDLHTGIAYSQESVNGKEDLIDLVGFVYMTGGIMSPTLCCPAYSGSSSVTGHYPQIENWLNRNLTLYDYYTSDNELIQPGSFDDALNDSLLVTAYLAGNVSGLCKYAFSGRVVPFKTMDGKYGLIKIIYADVVSDGYMEFEVKIQQ